MVNILAASTTYHMNNQDYTMCIRREEGYCSMEYFSPTTGFGVSQGKGEHNYFQIKNSVIGQL